MSDMVTINSLGFQARKALLDFANGQDVDSVQLEALWRRGLVQMTPVLTLKGCEVAQEGGWVWPD